MISVINIDGIYFSPLALAIFLGLVGRFILAKVFNIFGLYRYIWHRYLFDVALFIILTFLFLKTLFHYDI